MVEARAQKLQRRQHQQLEQLRAAVAKQVGSNAVPPTRVTAPRTAGLVSATSRGSGQWLAGSRRLSYRK
jgi:hypothetical protein